MMPLAVFLKQQGEHVVGSDRSYDQGKMPEKFKAMSDIGIRIVPQDGAGVAGADYLIVSSAIEESIPDVRAARAQGLPISTRGQMLARLFNAAQVRIAIAGTSGKSTVTGMMGTILHEIGKKPSVVNGGEIINFRRSDTDRFSSILNGRGDLFVAEMDESDGSIAHYTPSYAVLNNIALDHKSMDELEVLFGDYLAAAQEAVIVNYDQPRVRDLCKRAKASVISYAVDYKSADLFAFDLNPQQYGIDFKFRCGGVGYGVHLNVPGRHNVENALAALGVCYAMGLDVAACAAALAAFKGIHRRMELVGMRGDITVLDDFGHNPDKIAASLRALKAFPGRVIVMFQPHGFGPLRLMGKEMVTVFAQYLDKDDIVLMPEVYYAGGTVDRSVTAAHIIDHIKIAGVNASWFETRGDIMPYLQHNARAGDRIVIMGARDDTLHSFARDVLALY